MKVKLLTGMASADADYSPGDVVDLNKTHAERLIDAGSAERYTPPKNAKPKPTEND